MCPESMTDRLAATLERLGLRPGRIIELSGDVSPRLYFRVELGRDKAIAAFYPPSLRDAQARFEITTGLLQAAEVRVPEILANSLDEGVMLVEDFGGAPLFADGDYPGDDSLLQAAEIAQRIAAIEESALDHLLPPLDGSVLAAELDQTWRVAFEPSGLGRGSELGKCLDACLTEVCAQLDLAPRRPCHRDFMARNLMMLPDDELGVLDHQDLRLGPAGYDLASLVSDSVVCPEKTVTVLRSDAGLRREHFDRLVLQRTFKIVGTFFAFASRGATRHLRLVPAALEAGTSALLRLPEAKAVNGLEDELKRALGRVETSAAAT